MPVQFGELPGTAARRPGGAWGEEVDELRANPRQWALLTTKQKRSTAGAVASQIRTGVLKNFRPVGHFEAVQRGTDVWARYVGDGPGES